MIAYIDATVLLRIVYRRPDALSGWNNLTALVSSVLTGTECLRSIDRHRQAGAINTAAYPSYRQTILGFLRSMRIVALDAGMLSDAADPLPAPLGTLHAIHLTTALRYRKRYAPDLALATHDPALAAAARAYDFAVIGC